MATTPNFGWVTPSPTDFVTDLPADFETFADAVDADVQLIKNTADAALPETLIDAAGDLIYGSAADTAARLAIGTAGQVLTVSGGGIPEWTAPQSGGTTWTRRLNVTGATANQNFYTIAYNGSDLYVAAGEAGMLYTSADGLTWTSRTSGFGANAIWRAAYGNGLWVIVGEAGLLSTSTDGITWTARTANMSTNEMRDVIYANGYWVAVGDGGGSTNTGGITYSTDGITWNRKSQSVSVGPDYLCVAWNATNFVVGASASGGNNAIYATTPSGTWNTITSNAGAMGFIFYDGTRSVWQESNNFYYDTSADLSTPTLITNTSSDSGTGSSGSTLRQNAYYNGKIYSALRYYQVFLTNAVDGKIEKDGVIAFHPAVRPSGSTGFLSVDTGAIWAGSAGVILGTINGEIYTTF